jgi:hypothetical protein
MGHISALAVFMVAAAVCLSLVVAKPPGPADSRKAVIGRAVMVELFTSEGCSSCPPADDLLGSLRKELATQNVRVIPLGFHVDYWNSLGWKDRFSSADYSRRQEQYARRLSLDGLYTPQMVVDGEVEFVGNNAMQARRAITQAASRPERAMVHLSAAGTDQLSLQVKAPNLSGEASVMLAVTEDNLSTRVGSGENGGRTLRHEAVVRELRVLGRLHDGHFEAVIPLKLEKAWKREDLQAVVFVQEEPNGKIGGATSVSLVAHLP